MGVILGRALRAGLHRQGLPADWSGPGPDPEPRTNESLIVDLGCDVSTHRCSAHGWLLGDGDVEG